MAGYFYLCYTTRNVSAEEGGDGRMRAILHIDMDAFFASIEQRERPHLRGKPVLVGGSPRRRGVICTCSYEARVFGIHSGMSSALALRKCPFATLIEPNGNLYHEVSNINNISFSSI